MDKIIEAVKGCFGVDVSIKGEPFITENGYIEVLGYNGEYTIREKDTVHGDTYMYNVEIDNNGQILFVEM